MYAAGPLQTEYHFKNRAQRLLEAALAKKLPYLSLDDGEIRLEARRRPAS